MIRLIKIHILFLAIAMLIAFVFVPLDQMYFDHLPVDEIKLYYRDAFNFESGKAWKLVFTWFLGLSCGRLMLKALASN